MIAIIIIDMCIKTFLADFLKMLKLFCVNMFTKKLASW